MLSAIIYTVLITSLAAAFAAFFNVRIGRTYLPAMLSTGLAATLLIVLGAKDAVPFVLAALCIGASAVAAVLIVRHREKLSYILTTELFVFTAAVALMFVLNWGRMYALDDEFSHWGLSVKNLFFTGKLPFDPETNAIFPGYPPLSTVICFLGTCFTGTFSESATFIPMDLLLIASLLPVITGYAASCGEKGAKREGGLFAAIPAAAIVFCLLCFKLSAFTAIAVDTLLGALLFYLVWEGLRKEDRAGAVFASTAAFSLALIKDTGTGLAVFGSLAILAAVIVESVKKKDKKYFFKNTFLRAVVPSLAALAARLIWNGLILKTNAYSGGSGMFSALGKMMTSGFSETQKETTRAFFAAWVRPGFSFGVPLVAVICVFALLQLGTVLLLKKTGCKWTGEAAALFGGVTVCFFLYCLGVLASYWTVFTPGEATSVASFERYIGTYLTFWISVICAVLITSVSGTLLKFLKDKIRKEKITNAILCAVSAIGVCGVAVLLIFAYPYKAAASAEKRTIENYGEDIPALCEEAGLSSDDRILFAASGFETRMHLIANYNAAPWKVEGMYGEPEELAESGKITFVYFYDTKDSKQVESLRNIIEIPEGAAVEAGKLYRVKSVKTGGG